jgi:hypothetical protein
MKGSEIIQDGEYTTDEFIALEVRKLAEQFGASKVGFVKGVATRTPEGTLLRDLNGKRRSPPR